MLQTWLFLFFLDHPRGEYMAPTKQADLSYEKLIHCDNAIHGIYSLATLDAPPSTRIKAPLQNALYEQVSVSQLASTQEQESHPARLARNKLAPATSSGVPILRSGSSLRIYSPAESSVARIIFVANGPHASTLLVTNRGPSSLASTLDMWCRPALLAA